MIIKPAVRAQLFLAFSLVFGLHAVSCLSSCNDEKSCYIITEEEVYLRYYGGYPRAREVLLKVKGADGKSFRFIPGSRSGDCQTGHIYAKDERHVYYRITKIEDADLPSFRVFGNGYSADKVKVYYRAKPVDGADAESFFAIENKKGLPYGGDRHGVLYKADRISDRMDSKSFMVLCRPYYKDKNHVYYGKGYTILQGADPGSFTCPVYRQIINDWYYTFDRNNAYYCESGKVTPIPGIDNETFELLGRGTHYARDKKRVYYKSAVVEGADPESFLIPQPMRQEIGQDKHRRYVKGIADEGR